MKTRIILLLCIALLCSPALALAQTKGIYISQSTLEDPSHLTYLINRAKAVGINTFVVDFDKMTKAYQKDIELVKASGLKYVARVVIFTDGGTHDQVTSVAHWDKKLQLMKQAISLGASEIQLDYIRYNTRQPPSPQNAQNVTRVVSWYKNQLSAMNVPMQIDVFGITGIKAEQRIGQDVKLIGPHVDTMCPMVYPSHFEPYKVHAVTPYQTVYTSLTSLQKQFNNQTPFKLVPYIELFNYRYPLTTQQRYVYIKAQLKAVNDAHADGWYAWSASNYYDHLFEVLQAQNQGQAQVQTSQL